ncbi:MAG: DUF4405 domain-containing protein [Actinomycetota bacterium]|nr:DUF4405 domain-containing protein [Actinomycetota bacterium]
MKKNIFKIKLGIDLTMIAAFLVNMFTGLAMFFGLVSGGGKRYNGFAKFNTSNLFDLSTKAWYKIIHDWSGIIIVILILAHLILNWDTLCCFLKNSFKNSRFKEEERSSC